MRWKAFEELIALIQKETAPGATVQHNHRVKGRSGRTRQLDVTLSTRVGLHDVLIVIECKQYRRPVGIEKVEAFATKLRDVNAHQGVMISPRGFDAGARAAAKEANIGLWTYREAVEADWRTLMGPTAWMTFTISTLENLGAIVQMKEPGSPLPNEPIILDARGRKLFALEELKNPAGERLVLFPPGLHRLLVKTSVPGFVRIGNRLHPVRSVQIEARNRTREYVYNLQLGGGHVLQRTVPTSGSFQQLHSQPWRADEIIRTQQGRELSAEEWKRKQGARPSGERQIMNHIVRDLSMQFRLEVINDQVGLKR